MLPPESEGYMLLDNVKKFDASLNEAMGRMYEDGLCQRCRSFISLDDSFT